MLLFTTLLLNAQPAFAGAKVCNLLEYERTHKGVEYYRGIGVGTIEVVFSENGKVTSRLTMGIGNNQNYSFNTDNGTVSVWIPLPVTPVSVHKHPNTVMLCVPNCDSQPSQSPGE